MFDIPHIHNLYRSIFQSGENRPLNDAMKKDKDSFFMDVGFPVDSDFYCYQTAASINTSSMFDVPESKIKLKDLVLVKVTDSEIKNNILQPLGKTLVEISEKKGMPSIVESSCVEELKASSTRHSNNNISFSYNISLPMFNPHYNPCYINYSNFDKISIKHSNDEYHHIETPYESIESTIAAVGPEIIDAYLGGASDTESKDKFMVGCITEYYVGSYELHREADCFEFTGNYLDRSEPFIRGVKLQSYIFEKSSENESTWYIKWGGYADSQNRNFVFEQSMDYCFKQGENHTWTLYEIEHDPHLKTD